MTVDLRSPNPGQDASNPRVCILKSPAGEMTTPNLGQKFLSYPDLSPIVCVVNASSRRLPAGYPAPPRGGGIQTRIEPPLARFRFLPACQRSVVCGTAELTTSESGMGVRLPDSQSLRRKPLIPGSTGSPVAIHGSCRLWLNTDFDVRKSPDFQVGDHILTQLTRRSSASPHGWSHVANRCWFRCSGSVH